MDPLSIITTVVQLANTVYVCFEAKSQNHELAKELYDKVFAIQQQITDYQHLTEKCITLTDPEEIMKNIMIEFQTVHKCLNKIIKKTSSTGIISNMKLAIKSFDIQEKLEKQISIVDGCKARIETFKISTYYGNQVENVSNQVDEIHKILSRLPSNRNYMNEIDSGTQLNLNVVHNFTQTIRHNQKHSHEYFHDDKENIVQGSDVSSSSTSTSIDLDYNEEKVLDIYARLPKAVQQLMSDLVEKGGDESLKLNLLNRITRFWDGWRIDKDSFDYERDSKRAPVYLGHGATSIVYAGYLHQTKQKKIPVAVKIIRSLTPDKIPLFLREVFLHLIVQHHCVVRLYGMWYPKNSEDQAYIIVERMSYSVSYAVRHKKKIDKKQILIDIAAALDHLHRKGVVHRDVKLENILMNEGSGPAKLSDFGSSRRKTEETVTKSTVGGGTILYCPPEVIKNFHQCRTSRKWDVWSFGILICDLLEQEHSELYSRRKASHDASEEDIARFACEWADKIEDKYLKLIAKWCFQSDPKKRPSMAQILLHLCNTLTIDDLPKNLSQRPLNGISARVRSFNQKNVIRKEISRNSSNDTTEPIYHIGNTQQQHPCVNEFVVGRLNAAFKKRGRIVIEKQIDAQVLSNYLHQLEAFSNEPLARRFAFSHRDGSLSVKAKILNPSADLLSPAFDPSRVSDVVIHLLTTVKDYTSSSSCTFVEGWATGVWENSKFEHTFNTPHLIRLVVPYFDDLQLFLLTDQPSYLHSIRADTHAIGNNTFRLVYTVQVARRYRSTPEPQIGHAPLTAWKWPFTENYTRDIAHSSEVTLWAALSLTDTDPALDEARLKVIKQVIDAENLSQGSSSSFSSFEMTRPIVITGGNRVAMLRARHAQYQVGCARFSIARGAILDTSLLPPDSNSKPDSYGGLATAEETPPIMENVSTIPYGAWFLAILSVIVLYLLQLPRNQDAGPVSTTIFIVLLIFMALLLRLPIRSGDVDMNKGSPLSRRATIQELLAQARNSVRGKIELATGHIGRTYFDGQGLSFAGVHFTGVHRFPDTISLTHLFLAGYTTTYDKGGREILCSPGPDPQLVRLDRFDQNGNAIFERVQSEREKLDILNDAELERKVSPISDVVGIWEKKLKVGREVN